MKTSDFKTYIKSIREEALVIGFSITTMDGYQQLWNKFIEWKKDKYFIYNEDDYSKFLLEIYNFDVNTYTNKSKSRHQQLMRSKRMLDDFDSYKIFMTKKMFPQSLYCSYPSNWNLTIDNFLQFSKEVKQNADKSIKVKKSYLERELAYFYQKGLKKLSQFSPEYINLYLNDVIKAGNISKRRNFYVLREFLKYLFIENILKIDLSIYVPKIKRKNKRKLPTYFNQKDVENILSSIPKNTKTDLRNYAIILLAARLGLRISDILNIKLKNIDWKNYKLNVIQPKTNNLNILPLSKEVGWAIIDYIKVRPKCDSEYLFIKLKYPYDKMTQFNEFNKYFEKTDIQISNENKKGIHNLRHSFAKNMLDNDIPITIISSTLGHSNINTTSNTYLKIDVKNLHKVCLEVDE